jgi:protein SCO1
MRLSRWVGTLALAVAASSQGNAVRADPPSLPSISGHFQLETTDGRQVTDETYRGKWVVVYFGYTFCPDICPTVLTRITQALKVLGPIAERIQPIFITVDPARDSARHLSQYLTAFSPRIVGLRGTPDQTRAVAREFHAYYRMRSLGNGEYSVDHSSFLYVMAPDGHFAQLLADSLSPDQLADELRQLAK